MTPHVHARASRRPCRSTRDLRTLFDRCSEGDVQARETIVIAFLPYARHIARGYRRAGEPLDDLYQAASLGLIKAVDRYLPDRGYPFAGYAGPMIVGEIRRHLRDTTWCVHVPRSARERAARVACAEEELRSRLGSGATNEAIAQHLGLGVEEVNEARSVAQVYRYGSLDSTCATESRRGQTLGETIGDLDPGYERVDSRLALRKALRRVKPRDRTVLLLRFGGERTQDEIARQVGVSQMQISRILHATTASLANSPELRDMAKSC
jgi:RNA polymerase sigma-B factor